MTGQDDPCRCVNCGTPAVQGALPCRCLTGGMAYRRSDPDNWKVLAAGTATLSPPRDQVLEEAAKAAEWLRVPCFGKMSVTDRARNQAFADAAERIRALKGTEPPPVSDEVVKQAGKLTPEFRVMTPLQKWETLVLNGLIGTDEPWIEDMRQALREQEASSCSFCPATATTEVQDENDIFPCCQTCAAAWARDPGFRNSAPRSNEVEALQQALAETHNERARLLDEVERLKAALEPFASFAELYVNEEGWNEVGASTGRERIIDWFGPSDFREARAALASLSKNETER